MDYGAIQELSVTFQPEQMRVPLTITLLDDNIPEAPKEFRLVISRELDSPNMEIGTENAIITIRDTDGKITAFSQIFCCFITHVNFYQLLRLDLARQHTQ